MKSENVPIGTGELVRQGRKNDSSVICLVDRRARIDMLDQARGVISAIRLAPS
jgi:hypothetical protein